MLPRVCRKSAAGLLSIAVFGLLLSFTVYADSDFVALTVTAPYLDVRTGPGRGYPITHAIERGEVLDVLKRRTDWYKVRASYSIGEKEGWIQREALSGSLYADGSLADFSLPGRADLSDDRWIITGSGGDFEGADSLAIALGYRVTPNLTLELLGGRAVGSFSGSEYGYVRANSQPFPEWRVSPFFVLGAGLVRTSFNTQLTQIDDESDSAMLVGLGIQTFISRSFVARLEYNQHLVLQNDPNVNEGIDEWRFGFSVSF